MCRSWSKPFKEKYCQQCEYCGHPAHDDNFCGVGVIRIIYRIDGSWESIGCQCIEERYERSLTVEFIRDNMSK